MRSSLDRWLAPAPDPARVGWLRGVTYAHRGLYGQGRVENSPAAFAAAIEAGLGIECDVQGTADGGVAVFHDWDLDRLTDESGPVAGRTSAQLAQLRLRGSTDTIPSLADLLALVAGRAPLLVELKSRRDLPLEPFCRAVRDGLAGYRGLHAVMSFDPRVGGWFARHAPATVHGLVVSESFDPRWRGTLQRRIALWRARPDFLAYDVRDLPSRFAAVQRGRGLPLLAWTVASPALRDVAYAQADGWIAEGPGLASAPASS